MRTLRYHGTLWLGPLMGVCAAPVLVAFCAGASCSETHFVPVSPTGLPYTLVITDATIDGIPIAAGDEIGVFDDTLCVGAGVFNGQFNFQLTSWQGDPAYGILGFAVGNTITFRIWSRREGAMRKCEAVAVYSIGNGTFGYGPYSVLALRVFSTYVSDHPLIETESWTLLENYPNPFNLMTAIMYQLVEPAHTKLTIYNTVGQEITTLVDDFLEAGRHAMYWHGRDQKGSRVGSGIYLYRIDAGVFTKTGKMMLLH